MRIVKPTKKSSTFAELQKKVDELITENNRKSEEIRQIKTKLRTNAHYHRV